MNAEIVVGVGKYLCQWIAVSFGIHSSVMQQNKKITGEKTLRWMPSKNWHSKGHRSRRHNFTGFSVPGEGKPGYFAQDNLWVYARQKSWAAKNNVVHYLLSWYANSQRATYFAQHCQKMSRLGKINRLLIMFSEILCQVKTEFQFRCMAGQADACITVRFGLSLWQNYCICSMK